MRNQKYTFQKDIVFLTVSMFITVALWIGFNIYDTYVTSTITDALQIQIIPIDGKFDVNAIEQIKQRSSVIPDYTDLTASGEGATISPTEAPLSPTPIASPSAKPVTPTVSVTTTPGPTGGKP